MSPTPGFIIITKDAGNDKWRVQLANCDRAHAETVLAHLEDDPHVPSKLELHEVSDIYDEASLPRSGATGFLGKLRGRIG